MADHVQSITVNGQLLDTGGVPESSLLRRHYFTIGIGAEFLDPPPTHTLPQNYLSPSAPRGVPVFPTWEIVGRIKLTPEDFIVREISARSIPGLCRVADLVTGNGDVANPNEEPVQIENINSQPTKKQKKTGAIANHPGDRLTPELDSRENKPNPTTTKERSNAKGANETEENQSNQTDEERSNTKETNETEATLSPMEILTKVLGTCLGDASNPRSSKHDASELLESIELLHRKALQRMSSFARPKQEAAPSNDHVWVPPLATRQPSQHRGDRGAFHRALKVAFPLLCSETMKRNEKQPHAIEGEPTPWIRISVDESFFDLVPMLHKAEQDLPELYRFRNRGCVVATAGEEEPSQNNNTDGKLTQKKRRRRDRRGSKQSAHDCTPHALSCSSRSYAILRLRKDLAKHDRRHVHHRISSCCRDLETSTVPNYPIHQTPQINNENDHHSNAASSSDTTAAVVVKWSKKARNHSLKRKRSKQEKSLGYNNANIFCILKKTQKEHLTAIQHLSSAIRCRPSDIGFAGMKDMKAVTYQFCTIRATLKAVRKANSYLIRRNMELGGFMTVDWTLNQGDSEGNRFEIIVRDLSRVTVSGARELFVPCDLSHVKQMVERIRRSGFINFYGTQRLGSAGEASEVGSRPFDIGRAMLQQDFGRAVELLMLGRSICPGNTPERPELRHTRQVWKDSRGDPAITLKALPQGEAMARERTVLQGLKRYGTSNPLKAIKCLSFGVRTFWINAYQSFVWNTVATERIKRMGKKPVQGDLYVPKSGGKKDLQVVDNDPSSISLSQIVLPLPGYNVKYPENEIGKVYKEILARENVEFRPNGPPEATAKGSYRHLVASANNLQVAFGENLQESLDSEAAPLENTVVDAIRLTFDLESGSYATSMLRELQCITCERLI